MNLFLLINGWFYTGRVPAAQFLPFSRGIAQPSGSARCWLQGLAQKRDKPYIFKPNTLGQLHLYAMRKKM
jgi:hypothetical protein